MSFQYRKVLIIGASSGIGYGIAERLIEKGSRVIVLGRRKEKLDGFIQKYGEEKVTSITFDISKRAEIPRLVEE
jgi:NADP-dependent 3-hydroxy acid dehydrogenase YdfG